MSSLQNSKKTHFQQKVETKTFEKFGITFTVEVMHEHRTAWRQTFTLPDGTVLDTTAPGWEKSIPAGQQPAVDWAPTDDLVEQTYTVSATAKDDEVCLEPCPVMVLSTADGPIMGICMDDDTESFSVLDPCVINFDDRNGSIRLFPIFNVARRLTLAKAAVRAVSVPSELLLAAYPGFIIQNRMAKYQLRPRTAVAETGPTVTGATEPVRVK